MHNLEREKMALAKIYQYGRENNIDLSVLQNYERVEKLVVQQLFGIADKTPAVQFTGLLGEFKAWASDRVHGMVIENARDVSTASIDEYLRTAGREVHLYVARKFPLIWQNFQRWE